MAIVSSNFWADKYYRWVLSNFMMEKFWMLAESLDSPFDKDFPRLRSSTPRNSHGAEQISFNDPDHEPAALLKQSTFLTEADLVVDCDEYRDPFCDLDSATEYSRAYR